MLTLGIDFFLKVVKTVFSIIKPSFWVLKTKVLGGKSIEEQSNIEVEILNLIWQLSIKYACLWHFSYITLHLRYRVKLMCYKMVDGN